MNSDSPAAAKDLEARAMELAGPEPGRAADILQGILAGEPNRLSALRPLARLLMRLSRFEEARPHWERISTLAPKDGEPRMALGRIHARAGRVLEALDRLDEALLINPGNIEAERLRERVGRKEVASLSARIDALNAAELEPLVAALETRLAGDAHFQRLKTYNALLLAAGSDKRGSPRGEFALPAGVSGADESGALAFEDPFENESLDFLGRLSAVGDTASTDELDEIDREGTRIMAENPRLAKPLAQFHADRGNTESAIEIYRRLPASADMAQLWIEAAIFARTWGRTDALIEFCTRAVAAFDADRAVKAQALALLGEAKAHDAAIALLRGQPGYESDLEARRRVVRILFELGRDEELIEETLGVLKAHVPLGALPESQLAPLVEILRRLRRSAWRARTTEKIAVHLATVQEHSDDSTITNWTLGVLASARLDVCGATAHFERALSQNRPHGLKMDFAAEIALLHERFHHFGEAYLAMQRICENAGLANEYIGPLQRVKKVVDFCGWQEGLRYPECLIDVIFEEIKSGPIGYEPRRNHLLTISSSLRPGGSERQTVTVVGKMSADARLERIVLAIRSVDYEDRALFLRAVREMPIDVVHFGEDWSRKSDILADLPQLAGRERLVGAIELLPHNLREDIVRLCKRIVADRPQAVHLRQDLFAAAIACALAGVPRFITHRGSLSPDLWGHGPLESELFLRPMQHSYRHLLSLAGFGMVNNSVAGTESDRAWIAWPDPSRFRVIYNAIEFDKLDSEPERIDLRAKAQIPRDAFLIAGIFRIETVKRPMLWIETASLVAAACAHAHFVILGDGAMAQQMRDFAETRGFAHRLHMPGFVSNVGEWLRVIDLNLLTSEREGLPNVLIEGQHFGVPAVSSDVGGAFETIEPGVTGRLVPPNSGAAAFADAVLRIAADPAWRETARTRAPAFVHAKFGVERTVEELLSCLGLRG